MIAMLSYVERFKLTTKLVLGFSAGILVALVIGLNSLISLSDMEAELERMYDADVQGIAHIKDANLDLIYMSRAMRQMLIAQDDLTRDAALAAIKRNREKLFEDLAEARRRMYRPAVIERHDQLQRDLTTALVALEQAVAMIEREKSQTSAAAQFITSKEFSAAIAAADGGLNQLSDMTSAAANESLLKARDHTKQTQAMAIALLLVGVVLTGFLGLWIGLSIQRPTDRIRGSIEALAKGDVNAPIPHTDYENELGVMARALAVLQGIYRQSSDQHWVKSHTSDLSAAIHSATDFRNLAQIAMSRIPPLVGAGHAALYINDGQGQFNMHASYGFSERKHVSNSYRSGEGLVGQCAMEKQAISLSAPQNYIRIGSGLGESPPACVLVQPIIHGDRVLAVLEMASFQMFTDREKTLLQAILPLLGTGLEILDRNLRTQELLTATQVQAELMEKQAAQLEEQTVEMEAQQAVLKETEQWFRSVIESAPDGMLVVDDQGHILLANPSAHNLLGYAPGELMTSTTGRLLPSLDIHQPRTFEHAPLLAQTQHGVPVLLDVSCQPLPMRNGREKCKSIALRQHSSIGVQA